MIAFLACTPPSAPPPSSAAEDDETGETGPILETGETGEQETSSLAPLAELSDGACPTLTASDKVSFSSAGQERELRIWLPEEVTAGLGVVFVWHPLGGTSRYMNQWLDLEGFAAEYNVVVVAPDSRDDNLFEWDFWTDQTYDVTMYDDLRTCLSQELDVDLTRFSSTGMSAGALWTSELAQIRGDTLATILTFSGGTSDEFFPYQTGAGSFPALLAYGGESDQYNAGVTTLHFDESTLDFASHLYEDGHDVVLCNHEGGHDIPDEGRDMMATWMLPQAYDQPNPFADGDLTGLPDYCQVYAGS
jgi:predicted esterase